MTEVQRKIAEVRKVLATTAAGAVRLRGVDWFSWITGGGSSVVILTSEVGIAEVLITSTQAFVLTNEIERLRLSEEELPSDFILVSSAWADPSALDRQVGEIVGRRVVLSDRPRGPEGDLPAELLQIKLRLGSEEIERYRQLGQEAAQAMTEALVVAAPDWSENRLAGEGARTLWSRGIHPTLVLVAGQDRIERHRHPFPTSSRLGRRTMMVFCGRRQGLYANLTRFVSFGPISSLEQERMRLVTEIESEILAHSRPGVSLASLFFLLQEAYQKRGFGDEVEKQHFGGLTGYLSREAFARPTEKALVLQEGNAVAWNPTLPGAKMEDTAVVRSNGLEILTVDPVWPTTMVGGLQRPEVMVR